MTVNTEDEFGFLTYDQKIDGQENAKPTPTVDLTSMESKLDELNRMLLNLAADAPEDLRLTQAHDLVEPLLLGLIETSDKDWIHWPNRKPILEAKLAELKRITGG